MSDAFDIWKENVKQEEVRVELSSWPLWQDAAIVVSCRRDWIKMNSEESEILRIISIVGPSTRV